MSITEGKIKIFDGKRFTWREDEIRWNKMNIMVRERAKATKLNLIQLQRWKTFLPSTFGFHSKKLSLLLVLPLKPWDKAKKKMKVV